MSPLKWFLWNIDHGWSCLARPDQHFEKFFFFIPCPVFDVWRHLLTSFCNISLIWPLNHLFEQLDLIFTKYISRVKLLNVTLGTFWQNIYLIPCRVFDLWRHLLTSFCSISLILPLHRLFGQLESNFTKYLQGVKLFNVTWGILWKNPFLIQCRVFWLMTSIVTSFCSISSTCLLNRLFERLNLIFTEFLWWVKLFNKT